MRPETYYVYLHARGDNGRVFYVGKGKHNARNKYQRAFTPWGRNAWWCRIVKAAGYEAHVIAEFFEEKDAYQFERDQIAFYGRISDGGFLVNMTDGGEGSPKHKHSAETRARMRAIIGARRASNAPTVNRARRTGWRLKKGEMPASTRAKLSAVMTGRKMSESTRLKLIASTTGACHHRSVPVRDTASGIVYGNIRIAADAIGQPYNKVRRWVMGVRRNPSSLVLDQGVHNG